jgi:hypothetical protein
MQVPAIAKTSPPDNRVWPCVCFFNWANPEKSFGQQMQQDIGIENRPITLLPYATKHCGTTGMIVS